MLDLVIIGAGPAGLSASIYAQRAALRTVILEHEGAGGGQIADAVQVENYPGFLQISGLELAEQMRRHAEHLGAAFRRGEAARLEHCGSHWNVVCTDGTALTAKAVIAASGAQPRKLQVPGEQAYLGHGVSYCATCDGAFFRGKTVAVIGGGDTAVDDAILLSDLASRVYVVHRRDTLRANRRRQDTLHTKQNVTFLWNTVVREVKGDGTAVQSIVVEQSGRVDALPVDGVFVAIGSTPRTAYLPQAVPRDAAGYVRAGESGETGLPGLFAAGDVRAKTVRQVVTAVADGACCVDAAEKYIRSM